MAEDFQTELQELGLLPAEAQVYLALVRNGAIGGSTIASVTGFPRSSVYLTINSLLDKGLIEGGAGHGSRFSIVPPQQALPSLVAQEKEAIAQRENLASQLGERISSLAEPAEAAPKELVQVIRSPRAVAERFERLVLEAKREIETFVKGPILNPHRGNSAQKKAQRRGVRIRALYERALVEDPAVKPYLEEWVKGGEVARVYDGELPHKLVIFDHEVVLMPLVMPREQTQTLLIRNPQLALSLSLAFEHVWDRAEPLAPQAAKKVKARNGATLSVPPTKRNDKPVRPR